MSSWGRQGVKLAQGRSHTTVKTGRGSKPCSEGCGKTISGTRKMCKACEERTATAAA